MSADSTYGWRAAENEASFFNAAQLPTFRLRDGLRLHALVENNRWINAEISCREHHDNLVGFIHAEDILAMYPDLPRKQRETRLIQEYPAVFIYGSEDPVVTDPLVADFVALSDTLEVIVFEGVGHRPHFERQDDVEVIIRSLIEKLE